MTPLLQIKGLSVKFHQEGNIIQAVNNISFNLEKGRSLGIAGESGSGKSITAMAIMRLIQCPPAEMSGSILFQHNNTSIDLLQLQEKQMRQIRGKHIGMIFQEPMTSLNPVYKCGKQVREIIELHLNISRKAATAKTIDLFEKVKLPFPEKIFQSYPHQLSGGQKQRIVIAMAIACNPQIIIADEPTTALDVTVQKEIILLLKSLQKELGLGIIFISHDLNVIAEVTDDVMLMYKGQIVEKNTIEDVFTNPQHPYTKGLLTCRPTLNTRPYRLQTIKSMMSAINETKCESDTIVDITALRKAKHQEIYSEQPVMQIKNLNYQINVNETNWLRKKKYLSILSDINIAIYKGETLGLVGESGCGKTTLSRIIMQLIKPTSGTIIYQNTDITSLSAKKIKKLKKDLQIIFQDPYSSLNPRITIGSAIIEALKVHHQAGGNATEKASELLQKVELEKNHLFRYPHQFSGGQRQRICIARALSVQPQFLICDESVAALDVSLQAQILNLLNDLKEAFGLTYIFISHDLSVVRYMSDRIAVMDKGKIVEFGDADEVYFNPKHEYTKKLIAAIPRPNVRFAK